MDLGEMGWSDVDWIGLAQDRDKWRALESGNKLPGSIKCWETTEWVTQLLASRVVLSSIVSYVSDGFSNVTYIS
jgi:hypothetical protein